jgi:hypothetical protein
MRPGEAWLLRAVRSSAWAPALVVVAYAVAVKLFAAPPPPWLDSVAHLCGGVGLAYFFFTAVTHLQDKVGTIPRAIRLLVAVGSTAIGAIVWELLEFAVDRSAHTRMAPDLPDTLLDLALGLAGALAFAAAVAARRMTS